MKKFLSLTMVFAIIVSCVFCLNITTHAETGTVLYENDFESGDKSGWGSVYSAGVRITDDAANTGKNSLKKRVYTSYDSPSLNLYSKIKQMGAGTYHFQIDVMYDSGEPTTDNMYLMIRGNSSDENSFIKKDAYSPNYFVRISSKTFMRSGEWRSFTGSIKVLESDLTRNSGHFDLCIDGIPVNGEAYIYFDDIKIVKLSETGITNSDFSDGLTGWVSWQETSPTEEFTTFEYRGNIFGQYARVSTYGSAACNVDQIISYYGGGEYTLSFDIEVISSESDSNLYTFYLTSNYSDYHQWIGQREIEPGTYSIHLSYDFNASMASLDADNKQVHFRIQSPGSGKVVYTIDNVELKPKKIESATIGIYTRDKETGDVSDTNSFDLTKMRSVFVDIQTSPLSAPKRFNYTTSDPSIATVTPDGFISIHKGGTVTISGTSRTGNISFSKTLYIGNSLLGFNGYSQERSGLCWLACSKMFAKHYANSHEISFNNASLTAAFQYLKPGIDINAEDSKILNGSINDCENAIDYFLNDSISTSLTDIGRVMSEREIMDYVDANKPIFLRMREYTNGLPENNFHLCIINGYSYEINASGNVSFKVHYYNPSATINTTNKRTISYLTSTSQNGNSQKWAWISCYIAD